MIDSHCHLTYDQLAGQLPGVLQRAAAAGVERMITIGTSLADARRAVELCRLTPTIRCAIGIHPHHSGEAGDGDLDELRALQADPVVLALGEMGLDYFHEFTPRPRQHQVFIAQLELAKEIGKPIVIHCREAIDDCLAILRSYPALRADFHCFTGTADEARRILDLGHLIGFTGVLTYKRSEELREIARFIPEDRMLVETDAPYLSPEPHRRQKVNEPALVVHTARELARVRGMSVAYIDRITTANCLRFFRWS